MLHLHETILCERGGRAACTAALAEQAAPAGERLGLRLVGAWEAAIGPGKLGELVLLWEADGPETMVELLQGAAEAARDWRAARWAGRRETRTRLLYPSSVTKSLAEHRAAGLSARVCVQET